MNKNEWSKLIELLFKRKEIKIPEWGGVVRVRAMAGDEKKYCSELRDASNEVFSTTIE